MVRLYSQTGEFLGTTEPRLRLRQRTIRAGGILYELVAEDGQGHRDYRAMEPIPVACPRLLYVVNAAGSDLGTVHAPAGDLPVSVTFADATCVLWTTKDQAGRVLYLKPEVPDGAGQP